MEVEISELYNYNCMYHIDHIANIELLPIIYRPPNNDEVSIVFVYICMYLLFTFF